MVNDDVLDNDEVLCVKRILDAQICFFEFCDFENNKTKWCNVCDFCE